MGVEGYALPRQIRPSRRPRRQSPSVGAEPQQQCNLRFSTSSDHSPSSTLRPLGGALGVDHPPTFGGGGALGDDHPPTLGGGGGRLPPPRTPPRTSPPTTPREESDRTEGGLADGHDDLDDAAHSATGARVKGVSRFWTPDGTLEGTAGGQSPAAGAFSSRATRERQTANRAPARRGLLLSAADHETKPSAATYPTVPKRVHAHTRKAHPHACGHMTAVWAWVPGGEPRDWLLGAARVWRGRSAAIGLREQLPR